MGRLSQEGETLHLRELHALQLTADGEPCLEEYSGDPSLARQIFEEWSADIPDVAQVLSERFATIKEVTRRRPLRKERRAARNAPCSCGSGKRYKGCCGRR